jgi:chromosome segregation ATPase
MIRLMSDTELEAHKKAAAAAQVEIHNEIVGRLIENHRWEVRRLTARAEDAEAELTKFRAGYKRALDKLKVYRKKLGEANRNLAAAGLGQGTGPDENGKPALDTVQSIMDQAGSRIPMDDMSRSLTQTYIEREMRARGAKAGPDILAEVLEGDLEI